MAKQLQAVDNLPYFDWISKIAAYTRSDIFSGIYNNLYVF